MHSVPTSFFPSTFIGLSRLPTIALRAPPREFSYVALAERTDVIFR